MSVAIAEWIARIVAVYAAIGIVFAIAFAAVGVKRIDPSAREGTWGFRLLIIPGAAALWPLLARRWFGGVTEPPVEKNAHREAAS